MIFLAEKCRKCGYDLEFCGGKFRCPLCYTVMPIKKEPLRSNLTKSSNKR